MGSALYWEDPEFAFGVECILLQLKGVVLKLI